MEGYVTNQKLIFLVEALKTQQRPDMVIFYDGVNEAYAAAFPGISGMPAPHLEFQFIKARVELACKCVGFSAQLKLPSVGESDRGSFAAQRFQRCSGGGTCKS
jgi:hypothetical protein